MDHKCALLALFDYVDDMLDALRSLKAGGNRIETVFSPVPVRQVEEILENRPSNIRFIALFGGFCGALGILCLAVYAHLSFSFITGGKPVLPWVPWIVIAFEGAILGGVVTSVATWILKARLPRLCCAPGYDGRFSQDLFGVLVLCDDVEKEETKKLLEAAGAKEVRHVAR